MTEDDENETLLPLRDLVAVGRFDVGATANGAVFALIVTSIGGETVNYALSYAQMELVTEKMMAAMFRANRLRGA